MKVYKTGFLYALVFALFSHAAFALKVQAPSGTYVNDPGHTRLLWRINHLGLSNYTARFNDVSIKLEFDAQDVSRSQVNATIDPTSVDTGYEGEEDFDKKIATDEKILNAGSYPEITFVSRSVKHEGDGTLEIKGDLTLLGVTRPVILEAELLGSTEQHPFAKVPALGFQATAILDRTDFGQSFLSGMGLGDLVEIEIQAEFIKQ